MKTTFEIKPVPEAKFGFDVLDTLPAELHKIGVSRILLIIDQRMRSTGLTDKIETMVRDHFSEMQIFAIQEPILELHTVTLACRDLDLEKCDGVIGYGGWKCTDLAKVLSIMATNPHLSPDFVTTALEMPNPGLPVISIPTTPLNGAEIDTKMLIRCLETKEIYSIEHPRLAPRMTLIDPRVMVTLPSDLTATTGIDALTHGIEAIISMNSSPFSEILAFQAIALLHENILDAHRHPDNLRARYNVALGSFYSALALNMTGSGAIHGLAYPLTARYGISHPQAVSLMSSHLIKFNIPALPSQFVRIARILGCEVQGSDSESYKASEAFESLLRSLELPIYLSSYNIPGIEIQALVDAALHYDHCLKNNPRIMERTDLIAIYQNAL